MTHATEVELGAKVLIVDDDHVTARYVADLVRALGHVPVVAHDFGAAVRAFDGDVDLAIVDLVMPDVDGYKLARILRERSEAYVPLAFLTGRKDDQTLQRGLAAGADDLLFKPIEPILFGVRVTALLRIRRLTQALLAQAITDQLTGVGNRRALEQEIERRVAEADRYGRQFAVLVLDVDHFKKINDAYGHDTGDKVLRLLGDLLRESLRKTDRSFRYGGEEFVVVAPETPRYGAILLAERIRLVFRERTATTPTGAQTLSIGIALSDAADGAEALKSADAALYEAKAWGRDRVMVADGLG